MNLIDKISDAYFNSQNKKRKVMVPNQKIEDICEDYYSEILLDGKVCTDGSPCKTYIRKGNGKDLVIMFNGGGVAWDEESCCCGNLLSRMLSKKTCLYNRDMGPFSYFGTFLLNKDIGIFNKSDLNPFASWDNVLIQYATGDFHVGTNDYLYHDEKGKEETMHFNGYKNFKAVMEIVKKLFPNPERILLGGGSAGAFGVSALAGDIIDMYPDCKNITVFIDASLILRDDWKKIVSDVWKAPKHITDMISTDDLGGDWLSELSRKYGDRAKILYTGSTQDIALATFKRYMNNGEFKAKEEDLNNYNEALRARIRRLNEEKAKVSYYICDFPDKVNGGTLHCVCGAPIWHEGKIEGVSPSEWVINAVEGKTENIGLSLLGM